LLYRCNPQWWWMMQWQIPLSRAQSMKPQNRTLSVL